MISYPFQQRPVDVVNQHLGACNKYFPTFEKLIKSNGKAPFSVGAELTVADILLAELVESSREAVQSVYGAAKAAELVLTPYPQLSALHAYVLSLPSISAFMASSNWFQFPAGDI